MFKYVSLVVTENYFIYFMSLSSKFAYQPFSAYFNHTLATLFYYAFNMKKKILFNMNMEKID